MSYRYLYLTLLFLVTLVMQACGFQLRGGLDISDEISPIYLQQNSAFDLAREIKTLLITNKIALADNSTQANAQLVLLNETRHRRVLSVDGNGRAKEYSLMYAVNFTMTIKQTQAETGDDQEKLIQDSISLSRNLLFDPEAVLAVTNESEILYQDMRRNAARLILLKLQARSRNQSATGSSTITDDAGTNKAR